MEVGLVWRSPHQDGYWLLGMRVKLNMGMVMSENLAVMTECERSGMNGNCGSTCYLYLEGRCDIEEEINKKEEIKGDDDE